MNKPRITDNLADNAFLFVSCNGAQNPQDAKTRRRIRQQAMKGAATARKETGTYGQHNRRQYPVFVPAACSEDEIIWAASSDSTSPSPRLGTCAPQNFDLLFRAMPLMGLRLGVASLPDLLPGSFRAGEMWWTDKFGGRKVLSFIPSRYDSVPLVRYATDCVVAKFEQMMLPAEKRTAQHQINGLLRYQRALRELQRGLDSEACWSSAETLCATQLLGVFETLNGGPDGASWIRHVTGASRLMEARGVHRFGTEFERALLLSHIGPTVMASFLHNTSCFLEGDEWKQVIRIAVDDDELLASERALVVSLWSSLIQLPRLFKEATDSIMFPGRRSSDETKHLIERLVTARAALVQWLDMLRRTSSSSFEECGYGLARILPDAVELRLGVQHVNHCALRGTYAVCRMIKSRLLFALAPARFGDLEKESRAIARAVVKLRDGSSSHLHGHMFVAQSMWIANGIMETERVWDGDYGNHPGTIERCKFEAWNRAIGRRCW